MLKPHIYTIGETVLDIIFRKGQPVAAKAGGSMLNSAVSLGRMGVPVSLISEIGKDMAGKLILDFLKENRIDTTFVNQYTVGKTALALAYLDERSDASYDFYKNYPEERLNIKFPDLDENSILLFGSIYAVASGTREKINQFTSMAHDAGALIIYDPNIRVPHKNELPQWIHFIEKNIKIADLVRGSSDDFKLIFNTSDPIAIYKKIHQLGGQFLICTDGARPVRFMSTSFDLTFPVPETNLVSTIGAGDSFNAGLLYALFKLKKYREDLQTLKKADWEILIATGMTFSASTCGSYDNYISKELVEEISHFRI